MDAINTNQRKDLLSDLNKDVLRELCKYLDVHEFHRFALTNMVIVYLFLFLNTKDFYLKINKFDQKYDVLFLTYFPQVS